MLTLILMLALSPAPAEKPAPPCPARLDGKSLERVSIYNHSDEGEVYQLKPDDERLNGKRVEQFWNLRPYREMKLFVHCQYQNTEEVHEGPLPTPLDRCSFSFQLAGDSTRDAKLSCK